MNASAPPKAELPIAQQTVGDLVAAIASDAVAPGAGSAAAVGLALAAACAAKAVGITVKHRGSDERLSKLWQALSLFAERALDGGDEDALRFKAFMHDASPATREPLLDAGARLERSALTLIVVLERLAGEVDGDLVADIHAARALAKACGAIHSENLAANEEPAACASERPRCSAPTRRRE